MPPRSRRAGILKQNVRDRRAYVSVLWLQPAQASSDPRGSCNSGQASGYQCRTDLQSTSGSSKLSSLGLLLLTRHTHFLCLTSAANILIAAWRDSFCLPPSHSKSPCAPTQRLVVPLHVKRAALRSAFSTGRSLKQVSAALHRHGSWEGPMLRLSSASRASAPNNLVLCRHRL
jgi:hypothetical protein